MDDLGTIFAATFAGRLDAYAEWTDGWKTVREPLRGDMVAQCFREKRPLSGYTVAADNHTHLAVYDFDADDGLDQAKAVRAAMAGYGVPAYIETSRRGAHLWSVIAGRLERKVVHHAMLVFQDTALVPRSPKVELRIPPRDLAEGQVGLAIRLPTMHNPKSGKRYPMLDENDQEFGGKLTDLLNGFEHAPMEPFRLAAERYTPTVHDLLPGDRRPWTPLSDDTPVSQTLERIFGLTVVPGRSVKCPMHDDNIASLSVLKDDARLICKSPSCVLWNDGRGRGSGEFRRIAEAAKLARPV